jgi:hypothetical protein
MVDDPYPMPNDRVDYLILRRNYADLKNIESFKQPAKQLGAISLSIFGLYNVQLH